MRKADYKISDIFIKRSSPRAMSGESITDEELMQLFEAARWAPSSFNNQPWRFVYAKRDTSAWDKFFSLLVDANKVWCKNASVLCVIISRTTFEYNNKPSRTHSFDTGSAWENLALQASINSLIAHGMEGFDYDKAKNELHIPDGFQVEAMCAIGKHGKIEDLPEKLQKGETPSDRKKLNEIICEGKFNFEK